MYENLLSDVTVYAIPYLRDLSAPLQATSAVTLMVLIPYH